MTPLRRAAAGALASLLVALPSGPSPGQQDPKIDETTLAFRFVSGRYRTPVTCRMPDGSLIQREEAIVVRADPRRHHRATLRATFFGIDAPGAEHCFNLIEPRLPDRRGVLHLTYKSLRRRDFGVADFRRELARGPLEYQIIGGRLQLREIGNREAEPTILVFEGERPFMVGPVPLGSDGEKLLRSAYPRADQRRFHFEFSGPDDFRFSGYYLEDPNARR